MPISTVPIQSGSAGDIIASIASGSSNAPNASNGAGRPLRSASQPKNGVANSAAR